MAMDMQGWFYSLQAIYRRLTPTLKPEEREKMEHKMNTIIPILNKHMRITEKSGMKYINNDLYYLLHSFEIDLMDYTDKAGLLIKKANDPRFALG